MPSDREVRRAVAAESPFNPLSLVGSYCLAPDVDFEDQLALGLVVGEVQPGYYLVELFDVTGESHGQKLIDADDMIEIGWRFFDTQIQARLAFQELVNQ